MAGKKWIQDAIKNPGALTKTAKAEGGMTSKGTISKAFINKEAKEGGDTGKRATLAKTLPEFKKK